tara:strand:+ start:910 stop:1521 length:612 start_codon:yes stop_codon:yes gene_type:complete
MKFISDIVLVAILGTVLNFVLSRVNSLNWVKTYTQFLNFVLLPVTGYVITSIISTNIALSLGMVGALSIVRFRTPIKNPFELSIYFLLITIGIVANVDLNKAVNFVFISCLFLVLSETYFFLSKKNNFGSFFDNTNRFSYLNIRTRKDISNLINVNDVIHSSFNDGEYLYKIKSKKPDDFKNLISSINEMDLISYSIDSNIEI